MKAALLLSLLCCAARGVQPACGAAPTAALLDVEMCWADYYARAYGVPVELVQAVIDVESAWRPYVISTKGAAGLMQLTAPTAFTFGVTNRFRKFDGELRLVAAAYYAGEDSIKRQGLGCADADIYRYVRQVQGFFRQRQMVGRTAVRNSTRGVEHP